MIDKSKPTEVATENMKYYIQIINFGQSKICNAYKKIEPNPKF